MFDQVTDNLAQHESAGQAPSIEITPLRYREIADEVRRQPAWRNEADRCAGYYDGNQIDPETMAELEERGMGPLITNLVKPTIDILLGMEAKSRADWRVVGDRDEDQDLCEALSAKLHEAERETRADVACSEAYASQIKVGVGWVEVGRHADPFKYPYRVETVHRREIFWDWAAREYDLSDGRYFVRERWYPIEQVCAYLPEQADVIRAAGSGWGPEWLDLARTDVQLMHAYDQETRGDWFEHEWRNVDTKLVCLREVWYRHFVRGIVLDLPDGRTVELDMANPIHVAAIAQGVAQPKPAVYSKLRVSLWIGPHKLQDEDWGTNALPYVPFWGYREDGSSVPYGEIRNMIPLQDEINARRRKLLWLLSSKRVQADSDALDREYNDFSDLAREVARPDSMVILNPNRRNTTALSVENDLNLSTQQYQVMIESQDAIQKVAGIYNAMLGRDGGAKSGLAINSLVDQGTTGKADINDNYRHSRGLVGQRLLELLVQDNAGKEVQVMVGEEGKRRVIVLGRPVLDPMTGVEYRENDVSKALVKVALEDVPSTPAYRAQAHMMLAEVLKSLPPNLQAVLMPYFIESSELPKRREMADTARKALGVEGDVPDPRVQQLEAMVQQLQSVMQQGQAQYEQALADAQEQIKALSLQLKDKGAELAIKAEAQQYDNEKTAAETQRILAQAQGARADTAGKIVSTHKAMTEPLAA